MVEKKQTLLPRLRVMADYSSSGIWGMGPTGIFRHGMIEYHSLDLPPALSRQFDDWIEAYAFQLGKPNSLEWTHAFNATGRALATALKRFLGPAYEVEYLPENEDGSLGKAEWIS